ncbi:MAG: hypothetical protein R2847_02895 [Bacteroidia bacterium]
MKKHLYSLMILSLMTLGLNAQDNSKKAPAANPNAPEISFEVNCMITELIPYGGNGTYEFKFTNTVKSHWLFQMQRKLWMPIPSLAKRTNIEVMRSY